MNENAVLLATLHKKRLQGILDTFEHVYIYFGDLKPLYVTTTLLDLGTSLIVVSLKHVHIPKIVFEYILAK